MKPNSSADIIYRSSHEKNAIHTTFPDTLPELTGYVFVGFGFGIPELPVPPVF